ncbi:MAG TPA: HAD family phosphatase [Patescibacteria group bacterium]
MIPDKIKAVIFDVDGLIIDSEPTWMQVHDEFIARHQLSIEEKYKETFRGIGLKELVEELKRKFALPESVEELLSEYRELFYKQFFVSGKAKLIVGVEECARVLYAKGYQLAVATGGHDGSKMKQILESFNLLKYFPIVVSSDEVKRGKPDPEVFLTTAEKLGVAPAACLVLEDSVNGVRAGKAAGMLVFGINMSDKLYRQLQANGADKVFHQISEISL